MPIILGSQSITDQFMQLMVLVHRVDAISFIVPKDSPVVCTSYDMIQFLKHFLEALCQEGENIFIELRIVPYGSEFHQSPFAFVQGEGRPCGRVLHS